MGILDNPRSSTPATVENVLELAARLFGQLPLNWKVGSDDGITAYYPPTGFSVAGATVVATADTLLSIPFWSGSGGIVSELGFNVNTVGAGGSLARAALYASDPNAPFKPTTLLADTGSIDTNASTGLKVATGLAVVLQPHTLYHLAFNSNATPATFTAINPIAGGLFGLAATIAFQYGWKVSQAFGAMPQPFPTAGLTLQAGANTIPLLLLRFSAVPRL